VLVLLLLDEVADCSALETELPMVTRVARLLTEDDPCSTDPGGQRCLCPRRQPTRWRLFRQSANHVPAPATSKSFPLAGDVVRVRRRCPDRVVSIAGADYLPELCNQIISHRRR